MALWLSASRMSKCLLEKILPRSWLRPLWIRHFKGVSTGNRTWSWLYTPNIPNRLHYWKADFWLSLQCSSRFGCCAWCVVWNYFLLQDYTKQTGDVTVPWGSRERWRCSSKIFQIIIHEWLLEWSFNWPWFNPYFNSDSLNLFLNSSLFQRVEGIKLTKQHRYPLLRIDMISFVSFVTYRIWFLK